jgi:hypothetical protein
MFQPVLLCALAVLVASACSESGGPDRPVPAAIAVVKGSGQAATVDLVLPDSVGVQVVDADGAPVEGASVHFSVLTGGGTVSAAAVDADASGKAAVTWRLGQVAGANTLRAFIEDGPEFVVNATGTAGAAVQVAKAAGDGQVALPGSALAVPPAVLISDAFGNPVPGATVVFAVTAGGGSIGGLEAVTGANGQAAVPSWTLGASKGHNALMATVGTLSQTFTASAAEVAPSITVDIELPLVDALSGNDVVVEAEVASTSALSGVTTTIGGVTTPLVLSAGRWSATVPLVGRAFGPLELMVTARDVNGAATDAFRYFIHDVPPMLAVGAPLHLDVGRPSLAFAASCTDDDPAGCQVEVTRAGTPYANGTGNVSGTVDIAESASGVELVFTATDSRGQEVSETRRVYGEPGPRLTEVARADGRVVDLLGDALLYINESGDVPRTVIQTVSTGALDTIALPDGAVPSRAFLLPTGVLLATGELGAPGGSLFELRSGALTEVTGLLAAASVQVNGTWAIYSLGTPTGPRSLHRRDLTTGTDILISSSISTHRTSVAATGEVAWTSPDNEVMRYRNGTTTQLTTTGVHETYSPVIDAEGVTYLRDCCGGTKWELVKQANCCIGVLAEGPSSAPIPAGLRYVMNGSYVFYSAPKLGALEVFAMPSNGSQLFTLTNLGQDNLIEAVSDWSAVVFSRGNRRYGGQNFLGGEYIMSSAGTVRWQVGKFYAFVGRVAFRID